MLWRIASEAGASRQSRKPSGGRTLRCVPGVVPLHETVGGGDDRFKRRGNDVGVDAGTEQASPGMLDLDIADRRRVGPALDRMFRIVEHRYRNTEVA